MFFRDDMVKTVVAMIFQYPYQMYRDCSETLF